MFSCEVCDIFKKTFFIEHLWWLLLEGNNNLSIFLLLGSEQPEETGGGSFLSILIKWRKFTKTRMNTFQGQQIEAYTGTINFSKNNFFSTNLIL